MKKSIDTILYYLIVCKMRFSSTFTLCFLLSTGLCCGQETEQYGSKLFSFGILADIQYADVDKSGPRDYRNALNVANNSVKELNKHDLEFIVHVGDVIDRDYKSFDLPLSILKKAHAPVHYVLGNHEFSIADDEKHKVRKRLNNPRGFYSFTVGEFVFVILDGTEVSTFAHKKGSEPYHAALKVSDNIRSDRGNNAHLWNGGFGKSQIKWFTKQLKKATRENKRILVFCHWPLLPENGKQLWNSDDMLALIRGSNVVAWIAGHHHPGNYVIHENIHHLTMQSVVEAKTDLSAGIIDVFQSGLHLKYYGDKENIMMQFK